MKKILKATFVVAFAVAALCAGLADVKAAGVEGGPGSTTIITQMPPCPQCGENKNVFQGTDENGKVCYICKQCLVMFGKK